jgi:hypothetical protein
VLHLFSPPSAASSRCVLLSALAGHPYDATVGSFQIVGAAPLLLLMLGQRGPRVERAKWSVVHERPSER